MTEYRFTRYYVNGVKTDNTIHFFQTALSEKDAEQMANTYLNMFPEYVHIRIETLDELIKIVERKE